MPGFCPSDWMKAPMAYCTIGPILSFELRELGGGKRSSNQLVVCFEVELGVADEKIRRAEAAKGREPAVGAFEVALEGVDVRAISGRRRPSRRCRCACGPP